MNRKIIQLLKNWFKKSIKVLFNLTIVKSTNENLEIMKLSKIKDRFTHIRIGYKPFRISITKRETFKDYKNVRIKTKSIDINLSD